MPDWQTVGLDLREAPAAALPLRLSQVRSPIARLADAPAWLVQSGEWHGGLFQRRNSCSNARNSFWNALPESASMAGVER